MPIERPNPPILYTTEPARNKEIGVTDSFGCLYPIVSVAAFAGMSIFSVAELVSTRSLSYHNGLLWLATGLNTYNSIDRLINSD